MLNAPSGGERENALERSSAHVQDLSLYRTPPGFRGRHFLVVQLWWVVQASLFRLSPQILYGWRRFLLRLFGARIGRGVLIRPTARIVYPWKLRIGDHSWVGDHAELYTLGPITIGRNVCISQYALLITGTHDHRSVSFDILTRAIIIEDESWVATGALIHPGVTIGRGAVVGARAVLAGDVVPYSINVGAPAQTVGFRYPEEGAMSRHTAETASTTRSTDM